VKISFLSLLATFSFFSGAVAPEDDSGSLSASVWPILDMGGLSGGAGDDFIPSFIFSNSCRMSFKGVTFLK